MPAKENTYILPQKRKFKLKFYGVTDSNISVKVSGKDVESGPYYDEELHTLIV